MFNATITNITLFRDALTAVSEFINEGIFKAKKDGIHMTAVDPTMVVMVNFKYLSTQFEKYEVDTEQDISINMESLLSILKRASSTDKVTLALENDAKVLNITFEGRSTRNFVQPLIVIDEADTPDMNLDFTCSIDLQTVILEDGVGDASIVSDTIVLEADEKKFAISSKGDLNKVRLEIEKGNKLLIDLSTKGACSSKFSLDYFKKIIKAGKLSDVIHIELGVDYPAKVTFRQKDALELSYVLAPRVED